MTKLLVIIGLLFCIPGITHGQTALPLSTAAFMDQALSGPVSYSQAAYFVLTAADEDIPGAGDMEAAFSYAFGRGWLPKKAAAEEPVKLGELSFLIMESFSLRGTFLYRTFPGPRYAYRELSFRGYFTGTNDPSRQVGGEQFFEILGYVLGEAENLNRGAAKE
jgi:hypothetical protein